MKSLYRQNPQIQGSESYFDTQAETGTDVSSQAVAEGAEFLQDDLNNIRTQLNKIIGETNCYDEPATTLANMVGSTTKKIVQPVQLAGTLTSVNGEADLSQIGFTVVDEGSTDIGYLSTLNAGSTLLSPNKVIVRDASTGERLVDGSENEILGFVELKSGNTYTSNSFTSGANDDIIINLYSDVAGTLTANTTYNGDIDVILPQREFMADMNENFAMINAGGHIGPIEFGDRNFVELNPATGFYEISDGDNTELSLNKNSDFTSMVNALIPEAQIARDISESLLTLTGATVNNVTDWGLSTNLTTEWDGGGVNTHYLDGSVDDSFLKGFKTIDHNIKGVRYVVETASIQTYTKIITSVVRAGVCVDIPGDVEYRYFNKEAIKVYVNGFLMISDLQLGAQGDYTTIDKSGVTFYENLQPNDIITFVIYNTDATNQGGSFLVDPSLIDPIDGGTFSTLSENEILFDLGLL
jgi:hypothetical protein